jgi:hypothetical protein
MAGYLMMAKIKGKMEKKDQKTVGRRKNWDSQSFLDKGSYLEANQWLKTVQQVRGARVVCKKGIYKFKSFQEADQWMETMILNSIQESQQSKT